MRDDTRRWIEADWAHCWHPFTRQGEWGAVDHEPLVLTHGRGAWLWDSEGRRYLDGNSSIWTNIHGHAHPVINAAIRDQLEKTASLFRGVSPEDFEKHIRGIFLTLKQRWNNVPFEVVNDGEVTALAGSMGLNANSVLGVAMGTSEAAGYVDADGHIKPWLNELAFAPVDFREPAESPVDEWSGDHGCGALYFSQQAIARLAPAAGFDFGKMPFPEQLVKIQEAMQAGDTPAELIYETIGCYFGYAIAHYADYYDISNLLILGRVTTGDGGNIIINETETILAKEFPELQIKLVVPDEKTKRHGQAVAAASLPPL